VLHAFPQADVTEYRVPQQNRVAESEQGMHPTLLQDVPHDSGEPPGEQDIFRDNEPQRCAGAALYLRCAPERNLAARQTLLDRLEDTCQVDRDQQQVERIDSRGVGRPVTVLYEISAIQKEVGRGRE